MSESRFPARPVAERVRHECIGLPQALACLLDAAASHAGMAKSTFLLRRMGGSSLWYQHQRARKRISPATYNQYRRILCANDSERAALDEHWRVYQRPRQRPRPPPARPSRQDRATAARGGLIPSRTIDAAIALGRETTTLRLRKPGRLRARPLNLSQHPSIQAAEPRELIALLMDLGLACNAQAPGAVRFFLEHQHRFQQAGAAFNQFGLSAPDEAALAQSVSCLLRFAIHRMDAPTREFWSAFCRLLDRRLGRSAHWLERLRDGFPGYFAASPEAWRFRHHRARHFLNALEPRAARPAVPETQTDDFLGAGSCVLAAYSYLLQSQLVALTAAPCELLRQIDQGERLAAEIRRWADSDATRRLLGPAATDSERVPTALSTVYRSMANLFLTIAMSAGACERRTLLRRARTNIHIAYELLLADRPPWLHGAANAYVSAAAWKFLENNLPAASAYLARAADAYRHTADRHRAMTCETAAVQVLTWPQSIQWITLIFVE